MKINDNIKMGQNPDIWKQGLSKSITFSVTEACNLSCKYCYMTGKNTRNRMSFETAKKAVDYILANKNTFNDESVVWEFVGGEPFIEMELIERICDYIKTQMYQLDHPWFNSYRFNFSSNGLLYNTSKVQKYIKKNKGHLSIGISIDGNKIKHDMQRVRLDGSGSYDEVLENVKLWIKQFPGASTKATFAHDDLIYLKDSILSLWDNGIYMVSANVVFEDVWHEGDDLIFENQLKELGDYVLEHNLWKDYSVRFFDKTIGFPLNEEDQQRNFCGAGKMLAIDYQGRFFPCLRFLDFTLNNRPGLCIGDADHGIDLDKVRPFHALTVASQSKPECVTCEVASGCAWCTGNNYDLADTDTIFQRATFQCKMHKANVRACEYFWNKFTKVTGLVSPREEYRRQHIQQNPAAFKEQETTKYLHIITSDHITPHCNYRNWHNTHNVMNKEILTKALAWAEKNSMVPVFLGHSEAMGKESFMLAGSREKSTGENGITIYDNNSEAGGNAQANAILLVNKANIGRLPGWVTELYPAVGRINVILEEIKGWGNHDLEAYQDALDALADFIFATYVKGNPIEVNILTDIWNLKAMSDCEAGTGSFALAPNGKLYLCPAFYFDNPDNSIGDLEMGVTVKNEYLFRIEKAEICNQCDAFHCRRCKFQNKKYTGEINTPSRMQCLISHTERSKAKALQQKLMDAQLLDPLNRISEIDYMDPLDKIVKKERSMVNV